MIEEEITTATHKRTYENERFKSNIKRVINLSSEIRKHLGSNKHLFLEYEILTGLVSGMYCKNAYELGKEAVRQPEACQTKCQTKDI